MSIIGDVNYVVKQRVYRYDTEHADVEQNNKQQTTKTQQTKTLV